MGVRGVREASKTDLERQPSVLGTDFFFCPCKCDPKVIKAELSLQPSVFFRMYWNTPRTKKFPERELFPLTLF